MSGETELKQMVKRLINLGKLLAEAERHTADEYKEKNQTDDKPQLANATKAPTRPKRYTQST